MGLSAGSSESPNPICHRELKDFAGQTATWKPRVEIKQNLYVPTVSGKRVGFKVAVCLANTAISSEDVEKSG